MLACTLAVLALGWGLWLMFMLRYPSRWAQTIDSIHVRLARYGLSFEWMKRAEKGITLKTVVGSTVILMLACLAIVLLHPDALSNFLRAHSR